MALAVSEVLESPPVGPKLSDLRVRRLIRSVTGKGILTPVKRHDGFYTMMNFAIGVSSVFKA